MIHTQATKRKIRFAKTLRRRLTKAERALWNIVKDARLGARFWQQVVLLGWIADLWCPKLKLVIEVDGPSHDTRGAYDAQRAAVMEEKLGATTLRFSNRDVICNPALVEARLRAAIGHAS